MACTVCSMKNICLYLSIGLSAVRCLAFTLVLIFVRTVLLALKVLHFHIPPIIYRITAEPSIGLLPSCPRREFHERVQKVINCDSEDFVLSLQSGQRKK